MGVKNRGFTLVEVAIVLTIISILLPAGFALFIANLRAQTKILTLQEVKRNGDLALDTMETLIKAKATRIENSSGAAVCTTAGSSYSGDLYFIDDDGESFTFYWENDRIASESASTTYLTTDDVVVYNNFTIECKRESTFTPPLISVFFQVDQALVTDRPEESASLVYQTKIRLRNY